MRSSPVATGSTTKVEQELEYSITSGGALSPLTDVLFVRSQMRRSLQRSLGRLKIEVEALDESLV